MMADGTPDLGKTSSGLQPNVGALFAYVLGLVTGLIFFLIEKENKFVRFHAFQSICFSIALFVLGAVLAFLPGLGPLLVMLLNLGGLVVWIILMIQAFQGQWFKLPVIGDIAAKQVGV